MYQKIKILHIVPTKYGGGVETAANSFLEYSCEKFHFKVIFLKNRKDQNSAISYLKSLKAIDKISPDFILTSLWKSNLVTLIIKLIKFKKKYILFLHSTENKHFIDGLVTTLAALFAYEIWSDSPETLSKRINSLYLFNYLKKLLIKKNKNKIISFVLEKNQPLKKIKCQASFIYWGRICPNKNIDKAIKLFSKIYEFEKNSKFVIIGPDSGAKKLLLEIIKKLHLENNVFIFDYMKFEEIKKYAEKASFFIQLSSYEGMAMSVAESMQLGLIPIVTNVGQIKKYCKDNYNSFIYHNNDEIIISKIFQSIYSNDKYQILRKNAIETWNNYPTYKKDVILNIEKLIKQIKSLS